MCSCVLFFISFAHVDWHGHKIKRGCIGMQNAWQDKLQGGSQVVRNLAHRFEVGNGHRNIVLEQAV